MRSTPPPEGRILFFKGISIRKKNAACLVGVGGRGNIFEELLCARHCAPLLHVYNTHTRDIQLCKRIDIYIKDLGQCLAHNKCYVSVSYC